MSTFASSMAQDVGLMNQELQSAVINMRGLSDGVKTFLDLAKQAVAIPQKSTKDVIGPGGVQEVSFGPNAAVPFESPTISLRQAGETRKVVEAINNLGARLERAFGGTGGATIRSKGGF